MPQAADGQAVTVNRWQTYRTQVTTTGAMQGSPWGAGTATLGWNTRNARTMGELQAELAQPVGENTVNDVDLCCNKLHNP